MKNEAKINCEILDSFFMLIQSHAERSENHLVTWAGTSHLRAPPSARGILPQTSFKHAPGLTHTDVIAPEVSPPFPSDFRTGIHRTRIRRH